MMWMMMAMMAMMMMKCQFHWWRKLDHPEETTDLRQVTDKRSRIYVLCPVRGPNPDRSGVKPGVTSCAQSGDRTRTAAVWSQVSRPVPSPGTEPGPQRREARFHGLCPVRGPNPDHSGVKPGVTSCAQSGDRTRTAAAWSQVSRPVPSPGTEPGPQRREARCHVLCPVRGPNPDRSGVKPGVTACAQSGDRTRTAAAWSQVSRPVPSPGTEPGPQRREARCHVLCPVRGPNPDHSGVKPGVTSCAQSGDRTRTAAAWSQVSRPVPSPGTEPGPQRREARCHGLCPVRGPNPDHSGVKPGVTSCAQSGDRTRTAAAWSQVSRPVPSPGTEPGPQRREARCHVLCPVRGPNPDHSGVKPGVTSCAQSGDRTRTTAVWSQVSRPVPSPGTEPGPQRCEARFHGLWPVRGPNPDRSGVKPGVTACVQSGGRTRTTAAWSQVSRPVPSPGAEPGPQRREARFHGLCPVRGPNPDRSGEARWSMASSDQRLNPLSYRGYG